LSSALWELAEACGHSISFEPQAVPVSQLSQRICQVFEIDPLSAIASGALLLTAPLQDVNPICQALEQGGIHCAEIGSVESGPPEVWQDTPAGRELLPRPARDEIAKVFD
jgi:hydrogenase maturation factor